MEQSKYVISSLELHLFFARIMKEHALFLEAGFTPQGASLAKEAETFKVSFERLLARTVRLSDRTVGAEVLDSGEIVTEFTMSAESKTQMLTGIGTDKSITAAEMRLRCGEKACVTPALVSEVKGLNKSALRLLNGLINLKERILDKVTSCTLFTANYPLLIEHILREARLYRTFVTELENMGRVDCRSMAQIEEFWNRIMMEHALFIRGLLDPSENELIKASDGFAEEYARLLAKSHEALDKTIAEEKDASLEETERFRAFKTAGTKGIGDCKIKSVILPLLADHVLREANHYIRLLKRLQ